MKIGSFLLELLVLSNNSVVALGHLVKLLDEAMVVAPEAKDLRPQLVEVPLLPHPRPPGRFSVRDHPPLLPLVEGGQVVVLLRLVGGRVVAQGRGVRGEFLKSGRGGGSEVWEVEYGVEIERGEVG